MKKMIYHRRGHLEKILLKKPVLLALLLFLTCSPGYLGAQTAPQTDWIRQYGSTTAEWGWGNCSGENIYASGVTYGTIPGQTSAGANDAYVIKYNPAGVMQWVKQYGSSSGEMGYMVITDASGVYATGITSGTLPGQTSVGGQDLFIKKFDHNGNTLWTKQFGTTSADMAPEGIAIDGSGVYMVGQTSGAFPGQTNAGYGDYFIAKFGFDGTSLWTRQNGSTQNDACIGAWADNTGLYVCGWTYGSLPGQTGTGSDAFIAKYSADGDLIWLHQFSTSSGATSYEIAGDETGLYVSGATAGTFPGQTNYGGQDAFIAKYDRDGNQLWVRQYGTAGMEVANGISVNASGVYTAGHTTGSFPGFVNTGARNIFATKFTKNGDLLWVTQIGSVPRPGQTAPSSDYVYYLSSSSSYAYISGYTTGVLPGQTTVGGSDAYVVKLVVNMPPVADCGELQPYIMTETVQLDGSGSSDPDGDALTYQWSIISKPAASNAVLSNAAAVNPTFIADVAGTYQVQLITNDGTVNSDPCQVTVTVITPQAATQNLIADVQGLVAAGVLNQGQGNALIVKLQAAIQKMNQGNFNAAINNLNAFNNQVNAFHNAGILNDEQANALITPAQRIISVLQNMLLKQGTLDISGGAEGFQTWNVPNPFSTSTTIYYSLPEDLSVKVNVYDSRGREVSVMEQGIQAAGNYSVTVFADGLPAGIYYYRIQAGAYTATKKLILVR